MNSLTNLRFHQKEAVYTILKNIDSQIKRFWFEMSPGSGYTAVLLRTCQILAEDKKAKILYLTRTIHEKEQFNYSVNAEIPESASNIYTSTYGKLKAEQMTELPYDCIICMHAEHAPDTLADLAPNAVFIGCSYSSKIKSGLFVKENPIYTYSYEKSVFDGVDAIKISPEHKKYELAGFCTRLFEFLGADNIKIERTAYTFREFDICCEFGNKRIFAECKSYRDRTVSFFDIEPFISKVASGKGKPEGEYIIILLAEMPEPEKEHAFEKYGIHVWDISNLMFFCEKSKELISELYKLLYFPPSEIIVKAPYKNIEFLRPQKNAEKETETQPQGKSLERRLISCPIGKNEYGKTYESICWDILNYLFAEEFSSKEAQFETKDKIFRMDAICSIKGNRVFWQWLIQHYNSRFVVFEFKNYKESLEQNLIYVTEKYLFNAALRNVAIIISRKGFSKNARLAAEGCLKESGKLILDITDADLIEMLRKKDDGENPSDYLLAKLEKYLMSISK